jgi:DNA-binding MarR family transcriptional regulator
MVEVALSKLILDSVPTAMRTIRREMRFHAKSQLSVPQFRILVFLFKEDDATASALAEWQGVSLPAVSKMITLLVTKKFIVRTPNVTDRRSVRLKLTKKGERFFLDVRQRVEKKIEGPLGHISAADRRALREGLRILKGLFP